MTDVDKAGQYRLAEQLQSEQNFSLGVIAAAIAAVAGGLLWGAIVMFTGYMIGWVAIGVGALVGYVMQVTGKGLNAKFSAVAAVLAVLGCAFGNLAGAVMFEVKNYGMSLAEFLANVRMQDIFLFYKETLQIMDFVFWLLAMGAGWQLAPRNLTEEEAAAVYAWEHRPQQGMISE